MKKNFWKGLAAGVVVMVAIIPFTSTGITIKWRPIKPTANQTTPLTDEQQGIMAVRSVKASVVSITGTRSGLAAAMISGSGFIVSSDGYIVTNNHVVSESDFVYTVTLLDGKKFPAKVMGLDMYNDVAILKIEANGLTAVRLGNSEDLETGQTVFAIGNALGRYQNTVTRGVVSGIGRTAYTSTDPALPRLINLIQTDAAINPGNSGGPLVNMTGEVIGMNTIRDTGAESIGFAVPISRVQSSVDQLKKFGKVSKPYIGITFLTLIPGLQQIEGGASEGSYIDYVAPGSPAERAGLKSGDIITSINKEVLNGDKELDVVVSQYSAGTQILISYLRGTQKNETVLVLGEYAK